MNYHRLQLFWYQKAGRLLSLGLLAILLDVPCLWAQLHQANRAWQAAEKQFQAGRSALALTNYQKACTLAQKAGRPDFAASICVDIATVYLQNDQYGKGVFWCRQGYGLDKLNRLLSDTTRFKLLTSLGEMFHQLHQPDSVRHYWEQADKLLEKRPKLATQVAPYVAVFLDNKAMWAVEQGDYGLAETYLQERIRLAGQATSLASRAIAENHQATLYLRTVQWPKAEQMFRASLNHYPTNDIQKGWLLLGAANFYLRQQQPDSARALLQQAARIRDRLATPNPEYDRYVRLEMGQFYRQRGQREMAERLYRQAIELGKQTGETGPFPARAWRLLSQLMAQKGDPTKASTYAQKAIETVGGEFMKETARPQIARISHGSDLVESLRWKANLLHQLAGKNHDQALHTRAVNTYLQTFWLANRLQADYRPELSKLFFQQEIRPAYQAGIQAIYEQWNRRKLPADKALLLRVQEQSKAAILAEQQPISVQGNVLGKPDGFSTDPRAWQTNLDPNTALLHYSLLPNGLLLTVLRADQIHVFPLPITPRKLKQNCDSLRVLVSINPDPFAYGGTQLARQLFDQLLRPALPKLKGITRLMIVRDGALHQLPFEVLEISAKRGSYLLHDYAISYVQSARTALGVVSAPPQQSPRALSMAPFAPNAQTLPALQQNKSAALQASATEVNQVGGTISLGENARRQTFLEQVGGHTLLHLATHAHAGPALNESYIAFYPGSTPYQLHAGEIARLQLHHLRLTVLSACQSGNGRVHDSEGLLSLERAFAQAGCPSVVMAGWEANDRSTAELVRLFYEQLRQGKPVDVALQQAKVAFLEQEGADGSYAPPYYWAHLMLMGQRTPVYPPTRMPMAFRLGGLLVLLLSVGGIGWWVSGRVAASRFATAPASDLVIESGK